MSRFLWFTVYSRLRDWRGLHIVTVF